MINPRKSISQHYQETPLAQAWAARRVALLTLPSRNFGDLLPDEFERLDAIYKALRQEQV